MFRFSDNDFPRLEQPNSCSDSRNSMPVDLARSRRTPVEGKSGSSQKDNDKTDRNTILRVLKPHEHKGSYSINIEEVLSKSLIQEKKTRPNGRKSSPKKDHLCGNSLDADYPIRRRGKSGLPKKPKRISKTKRIVLDHRDNVLKAKALAENVVVENERIYCDSEFQNENVMNILCSAKLPEIRNSFKCLRKERPENEVEETLATDEELGNVINIGDAMKLSTIHNHNFKRYCDNWITKDLNDAVAALVSQIVRFQSNKYQKNPIKAVADKRFVLGFKQTIKYTRMNKTKLVICVPDMEDGMINMVNDLITLASTYCVPYVFATTRQKLGFLCKKKAVSCFGLLDHSSAEDNFNRVKEAGIISKRIYQEKCSAATEYCQLHLNNLSHTENRDESDTDSKLEEITEEIQEKLFLI